MNYIEVQHEKAPKDQVVYQIDDENSRFDGIVFGFAWVKLNPESNPPKISFHANVLENLGNEDISSQEFKTLLSGILHDILTKRFDEGTLTFSDPSTKQKKGKK